MEEFREACGPADPEVAKVLYPDSLRALLGVQQVIHSRLCVVCCLYSVVVVVVVAAAAAAAASAAAAAAAAAAAVFVVMVVVAVVSPSSSLMSVPCTPSRVTPKTSSISYAPNACKDI